MKDLRCYLGLHKDRPARVGADWRYWHCTRTGCGRLVRRKYP